MTLNTYARARTHGRTRDRAYRRRFCMQMSVNREVILGRAYQINFADISLMAVTPRRFLPAISRHPLRYIGRYGRGRGSLTFAAWKYDTRRKCLFLCVRRLSRPEANAPRALRTRDARILIDSSVREREHVSCERDDIYMYDVSIKLIAI